MEAMSTTAEMLSAPAPLKHWTIQEFLNRPQRADDCYEELIEGHVYVSPTAKPLHNETVRRLERNLQPLENHGYVVLGEIACCLTDESLPNSDVAVVRSDVWASALDSNDFVRQSPELAVEVHSPSNRQLQREAALYLEHGAEQVWIVYPKKQRMRVLTQDDDYDVRPGERLEFDGLPIEFDFR